MRVTLCDFLGMKISVVFVALLLFITACAVQESSGEIRINEDYKFPIGFSSERKESTIDTIVIHFSSNVKNNPAFPYDIEDVINLYKEAGVSAHYLIDRNGTVYLLVDEERQAFHAGKGKMPWGPKRENVLNNYSIGIELLGIGTYEEVKKLTGMSQETYNSIAKSDLGFTNAQYKALNALIDDIISRFSAIKRDRKHIISHQDYAGDRRPDPGMLFNWSKMGLPRQYNN